MPLKCLLFLYEYLIIKVSRYLLNTHYVPDIFVSSWYISVNKMKIWAPELTLEIRMLMINTHIINRYII